MNLFIAADDNYFYPAQVMLTSFLINNAKEAHKIYFLHHHIKPENKQNLQTLVDIYNAELIWCMVDPDKFTGFGTTKRFPVETFFRFLIPAYLPISEKRAIWLDVDLIVNGSLESFYHQDFEGNHLVGCRDIGNHEAKLQKLGCPSGTVYINSGVLLFNVELMRRYQLPDYLAYYAEHEKEITWFDQDVINGMFAGRIKALDCDMYNVQALWNRKGVSQLDDVRILHYIGPYKPWQREYTNSCAKLWDRYHMIIFKENSLYMAKRRMKRFMQRYIWAPFRSFRGNLYANIRILGKLRDMVKRS